MTIKTKLIIWGVIIIVGLGFGLYYYLKLTGRLRTGAEAIIGCQGASKITAYLGPPGSSLMPYSFFSNEILIHEKVVPYLDRVQKEINDAKIGYSFNNVTSFNIRPKIWGGGRSLHSWGIAIDINPETNPYQPGNYGPPQTDIPQQIIDIFKRNGFAWGGDWPGERDSMHFEWYGASVNGQVLDKESNQKILSVATAVDNTGSPNNQGDFIWDLTAGSFTISSKSRGYKENSFPISLSCFSDDQMNIVMESLPSNLPGSIGGKVKVAGNYPMLMPANIYLDGRLVGTSNLLGDYYIPNVHEGRHKVEAKIMFFPGGSASAELVPGENLKNINIAIGK